MGRAKERESLVRDFRLEYSEPTLEPHMKV